MIKKISKNELMGPLYDLVIEVECGNHFIKTDNNHVNMLNDKIDAYFNNGCEVFGYFNDSGELSGYIMTCVKKAYSLLIVKY